MQVIKAERWRQVDRGAPGALGSGRRCSACGAQGLLPRGEVVFDGATASYYAVVRCGNCGYDLLEPAASDTLAPSSPEPCRSRR